MNPVTLATLQLAAAAETAAVCMALVDDSRDPHVRRLARERLYDAQIEREEARERLIDLGANVRQATCSVLGLAWPVTA